MVEGLRGHRYDKPLATMRAYLERLHKDLPARSEAPVVVAALGPKMLALSGERSMGAVPYNVTPRHTAEAAKILGRNKMARRRAEGDDRDRSGQGARARPQGAGALHGAAELSQQLAARRLQRGRSRRRRQRQVHRRHVLWGDAATVKKGLRAHFDAGATHVCLQPVHADGDFAARDRMLAALADT